MKNKINLIAYILYSLILLILSFNYQIIININIAISSNFNNYGLVYSLLQYMEIIIFFIGYGITVTLFCIDIFNEFKYILIYSVVLSIFAVVIDWIIKRNVRGYEIFIFITSFICVIIGVVIQILFKIKQVKGEEDEK